MTRALFEAGSVAVITGAALGIGASAAEMCARARMHVVMMDVAKADLETQAEKVRGLGAASVRAITRSVANAAQMHDTAQQICAELGAPALLMNNAVTRTGGAALSDTSEWRASFETNFWGVVNGVDAFVPAMLEADQRAYIVNVGSKQGITNPPGKPIYNVAKAALRSYTELLQHELRAQDSTKVSAHLLVPGFTTTGKRAHGPGAWLPREVVAKMLDHLARNSFYIICPDNEVTEDMDRKRILWSAHDITEDRLPLSRWSGEFDEQFATFEPPPRED
jgi:NAD(P)-dependent dehydrogenase (short-subunit alcohol dehydrogenase family)